MRKLKKPTVGMLMATLIFSNIQLPLIYGNELDNKVENVNKQIVKNNKEEVINIPDEALRKGIKDQLGLSEEDVIMDSDMKELYYYQHNEDLFGKVKDLSGIEYATNLEGIYIWYSEISDISQLSQCTKLKEIRLGYNNIEDISPLRNCTELEILDLTHNDVEDVSPLSNLLKLRKLEMMENKVTDISPLKNVPLSNYSRIINQRMNIDKVINVNAGEIYKLKIPKVIDKDGSLLIPTVTYRDKEVEVKNGYAEISIPNDGYYAGTEVKVYFTSNYNEESFDKLDYIFTTGFTQEVVINPVVSVSSVKLNKTSITLVEGKSEKLTATINPSNATNKNVEWTSSNPEVATVDGSGNVKAVGAGSATITVTTKDGNKTAICKVTVINKNEIVDIPDINLKRAINEQLYKDPNADITKSELEKIQGLYLYDKEIKSLEGIQYCINLSTLVLNDTNISDIGVLSKLTNLSHLELNNNQISDIDALSGLSNLWYLELNNNQISDINALSGLTNLSYLELNNNQISDIDLLSGLTDLYHLELNNNQITNIDSLSGLTNLTWLNLNNNNISNIDALSGLINLDCLYLDNNQISDINGLPELDYISNLCLSNNQISDVNPISKLNYVNYLDLSKNKISDITPLLNIESGAFMEGTIAGLYLFGNPLDLNDSKTIEVIKQMKSKNFAVAYKETTIQAENKVIMVGDTFDELSGVYAENEYGVDITFEVEVKENTVDTSKVGVYKVVYEVYDYGKDTTTTKEIKVTVTKKIEGSTIEQGNGTESNPLVLLLQEENAIDEIVSKIESSFEYNIVDKPVIKDGYKIYKIKLNDKTVVANEQVKSNGNSSYIELKVHIKDTDLIDKLDEIFIKDNDDSNGGEIVPPNNGGGVISPVPPTQKPVEFNDIKGHWAEKAIQSFAKKGYINGYEDNTFKPDNSMTRAEFIKVVNKVFGYTQKGIEQFTDVNKDDWFYDDICIGVKAGYIKGKSKDIFAPNDNITREEAAMILTNIMKNKDGNLDKLSTFKDGGKTSQWAQSSVEGAIEAGYLNGDDKGLLNPISNITRAEAITMLSRVKK